MLQLTIWIYWRSLETISRRTRDDHANVVPDKSGARLTTKKRTENISSLSVYRKYIDSAQKSSWSRGCAPNALLFGRPHPLPAPSIRGLSALFLVTVVWNVITQ